MTELSLKDQHEKLRIDLAAMPRLTAYYRWDDTV